ncbi:hypothetical protein [Pseudomonas eucalypticola]|uniref:RHS repeat protein n=1 Tax=Pseudomonas eucalypticola TaxID=2599595 RepID=A0A7D5H4P6_9PSED|nr:hypothetical protein [Pseudomonas eucalypticola]QKZ03783.1 hypothetical protein HWQ56_08295 [Pseudomonas eucalypticola]
MDWRKQNRLGSFPEYSFSVPAEKLSKVTNPSVPTRVLLNDYRYDPWANLIEKRSGQRQVQYFKYNHKNRLVWSQTIVGAQVHSEGRYQYDSLDGAWAKVLSGTGKRKGSRSYAGAADAAGTGAGVR